jgi:hypothetical protein
MKIKNQSAELIKRYKGKYFNNSLESNAQTLANEWTRSCGRKLLTNCKRFVEARGQELAISFLLECLG